MSTSIYSYIGDEEHYPSLLSVTKSNTNPYALEFNVRTPGNDGRGVAFVVLGKEEVEELMVALRNFIQ